MNKGQLSKATGLLALKDSHGGSQPVRLVNSTSLWRQDSWSHGARVFGPSADHRAHHVPHEQVGYPVLSLHAPAAMSAMERAHAERWLANTAFTMHDLVDENGRERDILPEFIILKVVDNRKLVGDYAAVKAAEDAEWKATQRELDLKARAKRDSSAALAAKLDELGVNNMVSMVSEHTVAVDVRTLEALIALAQEASGARCAECGGSEGVKRQANAEGALVPLCAQCHNFAAEGI